MKLLEERKVKRPSKNMQKTSKTINRLRRRNRVRAKVKGVSSRPRLSIFKSNRYLEAQIIDDEKGLTLAAISTKDIKAGKEETKDYSAGKELAKKAQEKKVKTVVFDRGGYEYGGKIASFAQGARDGGLIF